MRKALLVVGATLAAHAASAQPAAMPTGSTPTTETSPPVPPASLVEPVSMIDGNFVDSTARGEQDLIVLARLGQQRGSTDALRGVAATLNRDHTRSAQVLEQLSRTLGLQAPAAIGQGQQASVDALLSVDGARFDQMFLIQAHEALTRLAAANQSEQATTRVKALHDYTAAVSPALQSELNQVAQLQR